MAKDKKAENETKKPVKAEKASKRLIKRRNLRRIHLNPLHLSLKVLIPNVKRLFGQQQRKHSRTL